MKQPVKENAGSARLPRPAAKEAGGGYGTSKLERLFASEYLDKMGLKYVYQYRAADIGRYFDFAVAARSDVDYPMEVKDGVECVRQGAPGFRVAFMVEVDGDYYHFNPETNAGRKMNAMQRRNRAVDAAKGRWCASRRIPLVRVWESDARNRRPKVEGMLEAAAARHGRWRRRLDESEGPGGDLDFSPDPAHIQPQKP